MSLPKLTESRRAPDGGRFPWGAIQATHEIGPYQIVEYLDDRSGYPASQQAGHGETRFHIYVDGKDAGCSVDTLDGALVEAIAYRAEGPNSRAGMYFMRMIAPA